MDLFGSFDSCLSMMIETRFTKTCLNWFFPPSFLADLFQNTKERGANVLEVNWEGPYRIREVMRPRMYRLETLRGKEQKLLWNAEHLKMYYQ